jgi:hypothetical protein
MKNYTMFFFMLHGLESKKNLYELFDIFVGVTEDKYNNIIEGVDSPAFLLRLSSINEYDNTIKHRNELIENDKKIDLFRSRRSIKMRAESEKMKIPYKFLLQKDDYIITNRGTTRIVSMRKALELDTKVDHFVATQQFLYLRPKEITKSYDVKYVDILIETLAISLNLKQEYSKDTIIKLKEGHTLNFEIFEVGQPVSIINKINGANEKIKDGTHSGFIIDDKKESRIRFTTKDGIIEAITKSLINVNTVKELEAIELNISENIYAQQGLVKEYEKVYYGLENAKRSFEIFTTELTDKFIAK